MDTVAASVAGPGALRGGAARHKPDHMAGARGTSGVGGRKMKWWVILLFCLVIGIHTYTNYQNQSKYGIYLSEHNTGQTIITNITIVGVKP